MTETVTEPEFDVVSSTKTLQRTALDWSRLLSKYQTPSSARASVELGITLLPFVACWAGACWALQHGFVMLYLALLVPAFGFLVRLFLIQHDCGHQAFFGNRRLNDAVGRLTSIITITPYDHWRRAHAIHHATSGNLSRRGVGDIDTLTVDEYNARSNGKRWRYRLYRSPFVMFAIGPLFIFALQNRVPAGFFRAGWRPWASTMGTNLALAAVIAALVALVGWRTLFLVHGPIMLCSAALGGWLFYVQHQFQETSWDESANWTMREAALHGSSHYELPTVLRWFTANIGIHHVHHLCSRIPFYRLPRVLDDHPELRSTGRLTFLESLHCVRLTLWDSAKRRLVTFHEAAGS
jgi:acyl-lipid omega-6 desaturase (Delta-12 desaturase)